MLFLVVDWLGLLLLLLVPLAQSVPFVLPYSFTKDVRPPVITTKAQENYVTGTLQVLCRTTRACSVTMKPFSLFARLGKLLSDYLVQDRPPASMSHKCTAARPGLAQQHCYCPGCGCLLLAPHCLLVCSSEL